MRRKDVVIYDFRYMGVAMLLLRLNLITRVVDARPMEYKIQDVTYSIGDD